MNCTHAFAVVLRFYVRLFHPFDSCIPSQPPQVFSVELLDAEGGRRNVTNSLGSGYHFRHFRHHFQYFHDEW